MGMMVNYDIWGSRMGASRRNQGGENEWVMKQYR